MNSSPWRGNDIPTNPRVLILGESHYDDNNFGEKVSFPTSGVVERYFEARHKWSQFFDKMAASFGYEKENAREFFEKVYFGNYIDVVCGIGDKNAKRYADLNRDTYNSEWFEFINQNGIDIVVCFSKLVYNHFPSLNESTPFETEGKDYVGDVGGKANYVEYCSYAAETEHRHCSVKLAKTLRVYGICHPSAKGGYDSEQIYGFVSKQEDLGEICFQREENYAVQVSESLLAKAESLCKMFLNERNDVINTQELTESFYQYIRAFCLLTVTHCKHYSGIDYRDLINRITAPTLGQISEEDYRIAIDDSKINLYETYLKSDHSIIRALQDFDKKYSSSSFEAFLRLLSMLAIVFVEIDSKNQSVINNDVPQLIKARRGTVAAAEKMVSRRPSAKQPKESAPQEYNRAYLKTREVDFQCFVRVVIPMIVTIVCCLYAFGSGYYFFLGIAVIPFVLFISGLNAHVKRCPTCRAWNSMYIAGQELINEDKVRVRRPLGSAYFRTSGRATFGVRQTFVSAEEKTYYATIKCRICGYETKTMRRVIDDKIR